MAEIKGITLEQLLEGHDFVDAIDADLQKAEIEVFSEANREVLKKVGSIRIETHLPEIHNTLRETFSRWGWIIEHDYLDDSWEGVKLVDNLKRPPKVDSFSFLVLVLKKKIDFRAKKHRMVS